MKSLKFAEFAAISLSLLVSTNASALPLTYAGYTLDGSSNIVTGGGLEWKQWDETKGLSIEQALTVHASGGWRLASNSEVAALFNAFGFGGLSWDADENTSQFANDPINVGEPDDDIQRIFVNMFGNTEPYSSSRSGSPSEFARAYFGEDADHDFGHNMATVMDDVYDRSALIDAPGMVSIAWDSNSAQSAYHGAGVALVRAAASVPEPSALLLLGSGLLGLRASRRRKLFS